jgi:hypothetical protein
MVLWDISDLDIVSIFTDVGDDPGDRHRCRIVCLWRAVYFLYYHNVRCLCIYGDLLGDLNTEWNS